MKLKCLKCNYSWETRKENPVSCPQCKTRLFGKWKPERVDKINAVE